MLTLYEAVRVTLARLRRNNTYQDLGEDFGVTHQTAWSNVQVIVAFLADVLACARQEDLSALVEDKVCLIDGLLIPTFQWRHRKDLLNEKHRRHGVNIQLFVDVHGRSIGASQAFPGSWHDRALLSGGGMV